MRWLAIDGDGVLLSRRDDVRLRRESAWKWLRLPWRLDGLVEVEVDNLRPLLLEGQLTLSYLGLFVNRSDLLDDLVFVAS